MIEILLPIAVLLALGATLYYVFRRSGNTAPQERHWGPIGLLRERQQLIRRERELGALRTLNREILVERDRTAILRKVAATALDVTHAKSAAAFGLDVVSSAAVCVASTAQDWIEPGEQIELEAGADGPLAEDMRRALIRRLDLEPASSSLALIPIVWQDVTHAFLILAAASESGLSEQDQEILDLLAGTAAAALENAELFEVHKKRSDELEVIREGSLSMTSSLELQEILPVILDKAINLAGAYDAHVFLYDGESLAFGAALWAGDAQKEPYSQPRENGLTYTVARSGEPIVVPDTSRHPLFEDYGWRGAILGLPLVVGDRVNGVMNIAYQKPHQFSQEELRALGLLADQAAVAIENAGLFQRTAADRRRLQLLYDITRELSSTLNPEEIMQRGAELTMDYLGASFGRVYLLDTRSGVLFPHGSVRHQTRISDLPPGLRSMRRGQGFVGWIAEQGKPARADDLQTDSRWRVSATGDGQVRSAIGAPLSVGGETRGVLAVFHREPGAFSQDQLELLVAISQQISLAWSNATRYRQVERRLAERTAIQQVAQVVNSRLEMSQLLDEVVNQVSQVLGYPIVDISLVEGDQLVVRASAGLAEARPVRIGLHEGVIGRVARTNEPAFVPDVSQDPDYISIEAPSLSEIAVPLRKGDVVIGVLNVESHRPGDLAEDDLRLLSLVADQVAIAVENAALYERLRRHTLELERKVADRTAELADALSQAQEADRLKSQFVSDVSHELRTPLSNIRLYLELLDQAESDRREVYLETLNRESDRLVTLIEDLLSISRIDSGSIQARYDPLSLNQLAGELVEDRRRLFAERELELEWKPATDLPQVLGDRRLLSQVLANLMTNALNYTPPGGRVSLSTEVMHGGEMVRLTVGDTGLGILPGEIEQVFDRFFRGSASREMGNPGTGLGLAISQEIMIRHRGDITVESEPGTGSRFHLYLPSSNAFSRSGAASAAGEMDGLAQADRLPY